jgi:hypothetical protein
MQTQRANGGNKSILPGHYYQVFSTQAAAFECADRKWGQAGVKLRVFSQETSSNGKRKFIVRAILLLLGGCRIFTLFLRVYQLLLHFRMHVMNPRQVH